MNMRKFFLTLSVCALAMVGAPQKASAQWVVSDPGNLVQSILQYLQDAMMEMDYDGVSKLGQAKQAYDDLKNRLDELGELKDFYKSLGKTGRQLQSITAFGRNVVVAGKNLQTYLDYFSRCDDYSYYRRATVYFNLYNEMSSDIITEMNELFKAVTGMKQGAGLMDYVDAVAQVTDECNTRLALLQQNVDRKMYNLLKAQKQEVMHEDDVKFLNKIIL